MFHTKTIEQIYKELNSSKKGLTSEEAQKRLTTYGKNILKRTKKISPLKIFISQFKSFVVYILLAAIIISAIIGDNTEAIVISVILILNAIIGFIQEYKAEKAIEALKKMISLKAIVIRGDKEQEINAEDLVPGDIIVLETGEKVPADSRLIEIANLQTQEAALTGESMPVKKQECVLEAKTPVADRKNIIFSGTIITSGRGRAIVGNTGMSTEIGKIAEMIQATPHQLTHLQKKLKQLGEYLGIATIIICLMVFFGGIIAGKDPLSMFMTAIALAVAAIPEGLPAVVTISLALGVKRMVKRNALIRKLPSVETLGSTTVICTDKTGTLTKNEMTVRKLLVNGKIIEVTGAGYEAKGDFVYNKETIEPKEFYPLLKIGVLCNNAEIQDSKVIGDPTEACLIVSAQKAGLSKDELEKLNPRIGEIQFTSERKRMSTLHKVGNKRSLLTKGAPGIVLGLCDRILDKGKVRRLTKEDKNSILKTNELFATSALRVLAFAYKETQKLEENDLVFVGLQAMIDPPREEAKLSIEECNEAGIKVVMITGDHKTTAVAIAKEIGLIGRAIDGKELEEIKDLASIVQDVSVYARVNPEHKVRIVEALQKKGHVVAMTGDGVNDAPALKKADIGVSMGISGTDVAKEASEMILTDDDFSSIVNAVEEGRGIYDNIKKFVNYLLSSNFGEVLILFVAILLGWPLPLVVVQILWINLFTDGLPALALGVDPISKGVMQRPPRKKGEHIVSANMTLNIIVIGILICIGTLSMFKYGLNRYDEVTARTIAFSTIVVLEFVRIYMVRAKYKLGIFSNKYLILAVLASLVIHIAAIYSPLGSLFFKTVPISLIDWGWIAVVSVLLLVIGMFANKLIVKLTHERD